MWLEPVHSVVDFGFYREVPKKSFLRTFGYLSYLSLLFTIFSIVVLYIKLTPFIQEAATWLANSMPAITIADGKATSSLTAPLILRYPRDNRLGILIDTNRTAGVSYEEMASQNVMFCLTQNSLYILNPEQHRIEQRPLDAMKTTKLTITGDFYPRFASYLNRLMYPIMLPIFWVVYLFWKLVTSLFYAVVGLLINAFSAAEMDFPSLYKLAVYSQTPVVILQAVMLPLRRSLPGYVIFPMGFLVTSAYLWQAIRQTKTPPTEDSPAHAG